MLKLMGIGAVVTTLLMIALKIVGPMPMGNPDERDKLW